jgi:hypothetical protein
LIQEILHIEMVSLDDEFPWPEIRSPVADCLDEPNQLTFISGELRVVRHDRLAEEGDWTGALMQDCAGAGARRVTVDDEGPREVRQLLSKWFYDTSTGAATGAIPLWFFCWRGSDRTRCWLSGNTADTRVYVVRAAGA